MGKRIRRTRRHSRRQYPHHALTAGTVRADLKPGLYADGNCLYLQVGSGGARSWILRVVVDGRRRDIGLGGVSYVSLADAREEAVKLRKAARFGGDPLVLLRQERRIIPTFESAAREVHTEHSKTFRNPKHAAQWIGSLETYAFPFIGTLTVDKIDSSDILRVLSPIWLEIPETARRVRQRIKLVFDWAKAKTFRAADNPIEGISKVLPKHSTKQKHFASLPYRDLPVFIQKLRGYDGIATRLGMEFLILTAARTSEVLLARWDEIDSKTRTWTVPAERMKAKEEHKVPLTARSLAILKEACEISDDGPYIFPGNIHHEPLSNMTFEMALRRMDYDVTTHGFRSTFRVWAEEAAHFPNNVVEAALAHTIKDKVEAAYQRSKLLEKRRPLMDQWARFVVSSPTARVVKFQER
jgi:integrase